MLAVISASAPVKAQQPERPASAVQPESVWSGVLVVALDGATNEAWALAQGVYADAKLKPAKLTEDIARVLAGEAPPESAGPALRDLADLRAAIHGDDAPSRRLLGSLAREQGVSLVLLVSGGTPTMARIFSASRGQFEATALLPDPQPEAAASKLPRWTTAVSTLHARAPQQPQQIPARADAQPRPQPSGEKDSFLLSGWFWGALGAAAALGLGAYALTKNSDSSSNANIPLKLQVLR